MKKMNLTELIERVREINNIPIETIPDIELYMDQLLNFLNQRLNPDGRKTDSQIFTKTMINNYTKDRILIPPKNKRYSKQHILLLILIYNLKGILSISDIKRLFEPILRDIDTPDDDLIPLESIYSTYLDLTETALNEFSENFGKYLSFIDNKTKHLEGEANVNVAKLFLSVLVLIAQANLSKKMAELILESYFPPVSAIEDVKGIDCPLALDAADGKSLEKTV
ncbi:conserved hypothetical protein [Thermosinus carboxydivorans Nor1]|uniref:DUF1836 domain-containing protein n=1 Tax=Thermosinus carboxydivorans Nor1 TaxID=401526 RepID=A1HNR7_9FIRM|nr:DUF1836 domain-containing protein [Thermosinus carboxydivorans]EAX48420.1 conserved hypothetical protein [Thermosinus carboxydivorans Nor1]